MRLDPYSVAFAPSLRRVIKSRRTTRWGHGAMGYNMVELRALPQPYRVGGDATEQVADRNAQVNRH